jgi:hypothetical protein
MVYSRKSIVRELFFLTTLALGSQPKQRLARVWAKREAWDSHFMFLGMLENVRE